MKNAGRRTVVEFDIVLKIIFIAVLYPFFNGILKLALKLAGIEYLTNEYIYQFLLKPWTIVLLAVAVIVFLLAVGLEQQFIFAGLEIKGEKSCCNYILENGLNSFKHVIRPSDIPVFIISGIVTIVLNFVVVFHIGINAVNARNYIAYGVKKNLDLRFAVAGVIILFLIITIYGMFVPCIMYNEKCSFAHAFKKSIGFARTNFIKLAGRILLYNIVFAIIIVAIYTVVSLIVFLGISVFDLHKAAGAIYMTAMKYLSIILNILLICICIPQSFAYTYRTYIKYANEPRGERLHPENVKKPITLAVVMMALVTDIIFFIMFISGNVFVLADFMKIPEITAHRGYSISCPENTIYAFEQAVSNLTDYIELDVRQTSDGRFVIMHDENLKRTTGIGAFVGKLPQERICNLYADFGYDFDAWPEVREKMKVPSLEDVFEFMEGKFVRLNLDLKTSGTDRNYAENLYELMVEYDMTDRCVITSSDYEILKEIKIIDDDIKTGYILSMAVGKNYNMKYVDFFSVNYRFATTDLIYRLHAQGKEIHIWTVNEKNLIKKFMDMGVDNIITDDPLFVRQVVYEKDSPDIFRIVLDYVFGN